jgi:nucleotide-binding universal stress UspA family protein
MNHSIVCGLDNSQVSHSVARVAARLARVLGHKLVLAHVADDPPVFPYGDSGLRETLSGIVPETRVLFGDASEALTHESWKQETELLVVGSRGRGPLAAALLGSVSAQLASAAECPVVIVPSAAAAHRFLTLGSHGDVVCALDDPGASLRALRVAAGLAERIGRTPAPGLKAYRGESGRRLRMRALSADVSAIVAGSYPRGSWHAAALGALANDAPVPVVVVPPTARLTRLAENAEEATVQDALRASVHRTRHAAVNGHRRPKPTVEHQRTGRFSDGLEQLPQTPNKRRHGRFSDGLEDLPVTPDGLDRGRFSGGIERLPHATATLRRGSFADGYGDDGPAPHSKAA